ncbi:hypothetical protein N0V93_008921 [Gnomoniopsis smithogilvyi]|uniref:Uncharacterized protein n=1 Tax=Gnomoniopsis smithogilvyi TaxID=1191159 RepID=A0A9W8YLS6_9PEZI|nr:hypothetical protein N0V93_008921 [Gnomoniopsis smithogilvyi]
MEIDLSGIASYAGMQEWLSVAQEIGQQLRLKVLCLQGESPVDGLQDVADWGHGQDPTECLRLAREEAAAWMWPPLKEGAAAIALTAAGGQRIEGRRLELFMAKILCASSCIHGDSEHTVWYSIVNSGRTTVDESLPYQCHGLNRDHRFVLPDWYYNAPLGVETPAPAAEAFLSSGSGLTESEPWVEAILVPESTVGEDFTAPGADPFQPGMNIPRIRVHRLQACPKRPSLPVPDIELVYLLATVELARVV